MFVHGKANFQIETSLTDKRAFDESGANPECISYREMWAWAWGRVLNLD